MLLGTQKQIDSGLFVLRVAIGCFMLVHGIQKLMGFSEMADKFPDPIGMGSQLSLVMAIGAEVGCSLLLILGLGHANSCYSTGIHDDRGLVRRSRSRSVESEGTSSYLPELRSTQSSSSPAPVRRSLDGRLFCKTRVETSNQ